MEFELTGLKTMDREIEYPFSAVAGQDKIKKALIINAVNPLAGGVLISGEKGTAKSTLVRGFAKILNDVDLINLPLNITEDRLTGSLNIDKAVKEGIKSFEPGILKKADGNILYIDEINLLPENITNIIAEVTGSRINKIEREGISFTHKTRFMLIGTMNPEEGPLRPQIIDRFGLFVETKGERDIDTRIKIIKSRLEYEKHPEIFKEKWEEENLCIGKKICKAKKLIKNINVSDENIKLAALISLEANCMGHRAEIFIIETAKVVAALENRDIITKEDIAEAAGYVILHRQRKKNKIKNNKNMDNKTCKKNQKDKYDKKQDKDNKKKEKEKNNFKSNQNSQRTESLKTMNEKVEMPDELKNVKSLDILKKDRKKRNGSGRRVITVTSEKKGRYVRYKYPKGKPKDIALDATLRNASINQYNRRNEKKSVAVLIKKSDIRQKIREKRTGSTIIFCVDASGSIGAKKRMKAVKGAVISMLNEAYQKRDKVGMIVFRKDSANVVLEATRSVEKAKKMLLDIATGGKTPLASGIHKAYEMLVSLKIKDKDIVPLLVIITDGKANISINGEKPFKEALEEGDKIRNAGFKTMVIDTENDFIEFEFARKLAKRIEADYIKLDNISSLQLKNTVMDALL